MSPPLAAVSIDSIEAPPVSITNEDDSYSEIEAQSLSLSSLPTATIATATIATATIATAATATPVSGYVSNQYSIININVDNNVDIGTGNSNNKGKVIIRKISVLIALIIIISVVLVIGMKTKSKSSSQPSIPSSQPTGIHSIFSKFHQKLHLIDKYYYYFSATIALMS